MANLYDFIRAAALVIGLGFSAQQDRKSWIWGDSVLWGAYAFGLFLFPWLLVNVLKLSFENRYWICRMSHVNLLTSMFSQCLKAYMTKEIKKIL